MPGLRADSPVPACLAVEAMRSRFELVLLGPDRATLPAAGEEAGREIRAWDRRLNVYSPASEISRLNREAAAAPISVSAPLFELLVLARDIWRRTRGAFDPTMGPLVRLWREAIRTGRLPSSDAVCEAQASTGMERVIFDPRTRTLGFAHPGLELNLNAIAKGHALDQAALLLREAGVDSFLLQGGTSSVLASGTPGQGEGWPIGIADPSDATRLSRRIVLRDAALGVSSQSLQSVQMGGRSLGHVISPSTGAPMETSAAAAVIAPSAAAADALSTALLVAGGTSADWLLPGERGLMLPGEGADAGAIRSGQVTTAAAGC